MRHVTWLLLFLALCPLLRADTTLNTDAVKKMVVFIYPAYPDGSVDKQNSLGTGFLIAATVKGAPQTTNATTNAAEVTASGLGFLLFITARHIVDPNWAHCSLPQPSRIYVRVNLRHYDPSKDTTGVDYLPIDLVENGKKNYFIRDDDEKVDAAVVDLTEKRLSQEKYDFVPMNLAVFASAEEMNKLRIGDSIASAGLIPKRSGENRNYPFFKFGNISNIPSESVWVGCPEEGRPKPELLLERVWFIAVNLVGGNSGSPVFYSPPEICIAGGFIHCIRGLDRVMIIGVQSSSFDGADVAGMTPIEDVFKIIERLRLRGVDLYRGDESERK